MNEAPTIADLQPRLETVRLFLCDVDGILTDTAVWMGAEDELKRFNIQDGLGLRLLQKEGIQVGKATTSTWSPTLKKMIALATINRGYTRPGTKLQFEITVEAVRHHVRATVVKTPFFNPKRKTATPVA